MEPILVSRIRLLNIINANRDKHVAAHEKAVRGWRVKQIEALRKALAQVRADKPIRHTALLAKPQSFVGEYDRVIGMLRLSADNQIKLDASDYDRYVRDKWQWSEMFENSATTYGNALGNVGRKRGKR